MVRLGRPRPSPRRVARQLIVTRPRRVPSLIVLLQAASEDRADLALADFGPDQIRWAIETGLGALLRRSTAKDPKAGMSPLWPLVQGADLTARITVGEQLDALDAIIRGCASTAPPLTLLKGMSICEQYYPEPHLRPMVDIDVLVDPAALAPVESVLLQLGYGRRSQNPPEFYETHHHTTPFRHPQTKVWVEVHRGLFPVESPLGSDRIFGPDNLTAERRPAEFRGRPVNRLSDELQLVYLASHWASNLRRVGGMVAMLDLIYLLKNARAIRWERIFDWLAGSVASSYVYLLVTYLDRYGLVELAPEILRTLSLRQRSFGRTNLRILHALLDRYVTSGRDFGPLLTVRNFEILWKTLLLPGRPSQNLLRVLSNRITNTVPLT